jgi:hypothetical protein
MRTLKVLVFYAVVVGALSYGLVGGILWLVKPDQSLRQEARIAPIPPRIAESIERKREVVAPVQPVVAQSAPAPVMQQTNVALTEQPAPRTKMPELSVPQRHKTKPADNQRALTHSEPPAPAASAAPVITTARSDVPY